MFERVAPERYDTLPDVPEPSENPHLAGHEAAGAMLAQAHRAGKLHHALLFAGPPGIGKATLAFHLAHHLFTHKTPQNAPAQLAVPDPASQSFRLVAQDAHPSLLHLTRPYVERDKKFKTVITVDEIRRVSRFLSLTPHDGGYRVVIVDPADDMNVSAANALLKNLEEPPPRTLFVLIVHSPGRLLPTIRSRCQLVRLQPLESGQLGGLLQALSAPLPDDQTERQALVDRSQGSVRNAILLTQFGGAEIAGVLEAVVSAPVFDVVEAHKLGEAVSGRDKQVQFNIFNRAALDLVEDRTRGLAEQGNAEGAGEMAALWEELVGMIRDAETYNLDRKQHVAGIAARLHAVF